MSDLFPASCARTLPSSTSSAFNLVCITALPAALLLAEDEDEDEDDAEAEEEEGMFLAAMALPHPATGHERLPLEALLTLVVMHSLQK